MAAADDIAPPPAKRRRVAGIIKQSPLKMPWFEFGCQLALKHYEECTAEMEKKDEIILRQSCPPGEELDALQQKSLLENTGYPCGLPGGVLLRQLRRTLALFDKTREMHQTMFHEAFLQAMTEGLYGDEFTTQYGRIIEANNWDSASVGTIIRCPRQVGKTTAVCMFLAAVMHTVPGYKVIVLSTGDRISDQLRLETIAYFKTLSKDAESRIVVNSSERFEVRGTGRFSNILTTMRALPASEKIDCGPWGGSFLCCRLVCLSACLSVCLPVWLRYILCLSFRVGTSLYNICYLMRVSVAYVQ